MCGSVQGVGNSLGGVESRVKFIVEEVLREDRGVRSSLWGNTVERSKTSVNINIKNSTY